MSRVLLLVCVGLLPLVGARAEVVIVNPGLADRETLTYTETVGAASRPLEATLTLVSDAPSHYEYRSVGAELESLYRLDPATLLSFSSDTVTKSPEVTVHRASEYRNLKVKAGPDDLVVTDMGSLPVVLRGFPWGRVSSAKFVYVGNTNFGGSAVTFELQVVGRETVAAAGRSWECWHATSGLAGALSLLLPKTDWWFAVEGTHPLIKSSGPSGGPGSPQRTLVLQSYRAGR